MALRTQFAAFSASLLLLGGIPYTQAATPQEVAKPDIKAPEPIKLSEAVTDAIVTEELQRSVLSRLNKAERNKELSKELDYLKSDLDALVANIDNKSSNLNPQYLNQQLTDLQHRITTVVAQLEGISLQIQSDNSAIHADMGKWEARIKWLDTQKVPPSIIQSAKSIVQRLENTSSLLQNARNEVLLTLSQAIFLQEISNAAQQKIANVLVNQHLEYLTLEKRPIWALDNSPKGGIWQELNSAWKLLSAYANQHLAFLLTFSIVSFIFNFFIFRLGVHKAVLPVQTAYGRPYSACLLILLMALGWLSPNPPALFYEVLVLIAPIPAARLLDRALARPIPLTLYGIAISTVFISIRHFVEDGNVIDRVLLIIQSLFIAFAFMADLKNGHLIKAIPKSNPSLIRFVTWLIGVMSFLTIIGALIGFRGPLSILRLDVGGILGIAMVYGATSLACFGCVLALLGSPILSWLNCARNKDPDLLRSIRLSLVIATVWGVLMVSVGALDLAPFLTAALQRFMASTFKIGSISIDAHAIVSALVVIVATYVITNVTSFILNSELMPRLSMRPGSKFAIVTITRWIMVIVGIVLSMGALGLDMSKVTLVAGALSVGIGFGLQNVVNNFVSGLILIIERPVGVGDVIEWGSQSGTVTRIGIRSSTVRTRQGAEILVPNGELVSKEVVNWTRSDRRRRYDIAITVNAGSSPEKVIQLIQEAAESVPEIMKTPAPQVIFKGFDDSSQNYMLLAWVGAIEVGAQAQNDLQIAVLKKLEEAGIVAHAPAAS